jgi:hypothetical protein
MHRSHVIRWLALAVCLLGVQCDSLSDDCATTLTCDGVGAVLDDDCVWRYANGTVWTESPRRNESGVWVWPDGRATDTQTFDCTGPVVDAGADAGAGAPDCTVIACDDGQQCEPDSRRCVECLTNDQCGVNAAAGDAGISAELRVCDEVSHSCVRCMADTDCSGDAPVCKTVAGNSRQNECVECTTDLECGGDTPVCDLQTNECSVTCTDAAQCGGDKPVCNTTRQVCVECLGNAECTAQGALQCNTTSNECVQCIDDVPCAGAGQVCDTAGGNVCVQCKDDNQCGGAAPVCDPDSKTCVTCLNDLQCLAVGASRCNTVTHACVGCNADIQCEGGALCNVTEGRCVQCVTDTHCSGTPNQQCDEATGACVECTDTAQCLTADAARCELAPNPDPITDKNTCVGCLDNADCGNKPGIPGLCRTDGLCVDCRNFADCSGDETRSRCLGSGACAPCRVGSTDCSAVEGKNACAQVGDITSCVECTSNANCSAELGGLVCKLTAVGNAALAINTCVECVADADCTSPGASNCVQNQCQPCAADADCSAQAGRGICDLAGGADGGTPECVQCTGLKFQACEAGANVCNSLTRTCTDSPVGSAVNDCDACVSDAQCASDSRCVLQTTGGTGYFCFPAGPTCSSVPFVVVTNGTIDSTTRTACTLQRTTCAGYRDFGIQSCGDDDDCGLENIDDGVCAGSEVCTLPCASPMDCAGGLCSGGACSF